MFHVFAHQTRGSLHQFETKFRETNQVEMKARTGGIPSCVDRALNMKLTDHKFLMPFDSSKARTTRTQLVFCPRTLRFFWGGGHNFINYGRTP